jgi:hypothetical protein
MIKKLVLGLMSFVSVLGAEDLKPWFDRDLELHTNFSFAHQRYTEIDSDGETFPFVSKDEFYDMGVHSSCGPYALELSTGLARSWARSLSLDYVSEIIRYQLSSEDIGDLVSSTVGLLLSQIPTISLHDPSVIHHGNFEGELHLAVGREKFLRRDWDTRCYLFFGAGVGDHGSPWIRSFIDVEKKCWLYQTVSARLSWERGLGSKILLPYNFNGYGPLAYRLVDLNAGYRVVLNPDSSLKIDYTLRLYAHNAPKNLNRFQITYNYSFGL